MGNKIQRSLLILLAIIGLQGCKLKEIQRLSETARIAQDHHGAINKERFDPFGAVTDYGVEFFELHDVYFFTDYATSGPIERVNIGYNRGQRCVCSVKRVFGGEFAVYDCSNPGLYRNICSLEGEQKLGGLEEITSPYIATEADVFGDFVVVEYDGQVCFTAELQNELTGVGVNEDYFCTGYTREV